MGLVGVICKKLELSRASATVDLRSCGFCNVDGLRLLFDIGIAARRTMVDLRGLPSRELTGISWRKGQGDVNPWFAEIRRAFGAQGAAAEDMRRLNLEIIDVCMGTTRRTIRPDSWKAGGRATPRSQAVSVAGSAMSAAKPACLERSSQYGWCEPLRIEVGVIFGVP